MSAVAATSCATAATSFVQKSISLKKDVQVKSVNGLPAFSSSRIVCSSEKKEQAPISKAVAALTAASTFAASHPALALVDERLSTEGTGLKLGLSDPSLGWILFGVPLTVWALYYVFSSKLPQGDDDSGLSL